MIADKVYPMLEGHNEPPHKLKNISLATPVPSVLIPYPSIGLKSSVHA